MDVVIQNHFSSEDLPRKICKLRFLQILVATILKLQLQELKHKEMIN